MSSLAAYSGLFALTLVGCGTGEPIEPSGPANYSDGLGDAPDFSEGHGRIVMESWFQYEENSLSGFFADGPAPRLQVEAERIGQCRRLGYTPTICTPTCESTHMCIEGECVAWPERVDWGELDWSWPDGDEAVPANDLLEYWATGSAVETGEASIAFEEVTLSAPTVEAPDPNGDWEKAVKNRNGDAVLSWNNPAENARVRLYMTDCVGTHGGIGDAEIECEGPDTGELVIPGEFLDALEAGDWTHGECGVHSLERYYAAAPSDDDRLRFETVTSADFYYFPR